MGSAISARFPTAPAAWKTACRCCGRRGVNSGRLTREEFVAVTSTNIARILNVYPRKGAVAVESDADLIVWDPKATKTITAKKQLSRIDYNVFEGYACTGLRWRRCAAARWRGWNGDLRAESGDGHYVERPAFSPVHVANSTWEDADRAEGRGAGPRSRHEQRKLQREVQRVAGTALCGLARQPARRCSCGPRS